MNNKQQLFKNVKFTKLDDIISKQGFKKGHLYILDKFSNTFKEIKIDKK